MPSRPPHMLGWTLVALAISAALGVAVFAPRRVRLPEAGSPTRVAAPSRDAAVSQFFRTEPITAASVVVRTLTPVAARFSWELQTTEPYDRSRQFRPLAAGSVLLAGSQDVATTALPIRPTDLAGRELLLVAWFEGAGAREARLEVSGLNAYPGQLTVGRRSTFGDVVLAVEGRSLYSDVADRLAGLPAIFRSPLPALAVLAVWAAALTVVLGSALFDEEHA